MVRRLVEEVRGLEVGRGEVVEVVRSPIRFVSFLLPPLPSFVPFSFPFDLHCFFISICGLLCFSRSTSRFAVFRERVYGRRTEQLLTEILF